MLGGGVTSGGAHREAQEARHKHPKAVDHKLAWGDALDVQGCDLAPQKPLCILEVDECIIDRT